MTDARESKNHERMQIQAANPKFNFEQMVISAGCDGTRLHTGAFHSWYCTFSVDSVRAPAASKSNMDG